MTLSEKLLRLMKPENIAEFYDRVKTNSQRLLDRTRKNGRRLRSKIEIQKRKEIESK